VTLALCSVGWLLCALFCTLRAVVSGLCATLSSVVVNARFCALTLQCKKGGESAFQKAALEKGSVLTKTKEPSPSLERRGPGYALWLCVLCACIRALFCLSEAVWTAPSWGGVASVHERRVRLLVCLMCACANVAPHSESIPSLFDDLFVCHSYDVMLGSPYDSMVASSTNLPTSPTANNLVNSANVSLTTSANK
jgi:hypothetical protein